MADDSSRNFCPHYPAPSAHRLPWWRIFFGKQRSWLDGLYQGSYHMKMGELHLPGMDLYMVNEPHWVRAVLVERVGDFPKHELLGEALKPLLGDSIFTTNGAQWQRQRALMAPSFDAARVGQVQGKMLDAARAMIERLSSKKEAADVDVDVELEMTHVAADVILRTLMSRSLDGASAQRVFDAFARYQSLAPRLMMPAFFGVRWLRPWGLKAQSASAAAEIRALLQDMIRPRFEKVQAQGLAPDGEPYTDLLEGLLSARDPQTGEGWSFDALVDQVAMLFLAGHETSASALSWALHLLAHSPEVQARCRAEALTWEVGEGDDGRMPRLDLIRNVFRETLRLFPPVGFLARQSRVDVRLRDKLMRSGAAVVISPWLLHRHRELWSRPDEFDPDRYGDPGSSLDCPHASQSLKEAYLPFGMGPRVCIGAAFALQEASIVLAMLLRNFQILPAPGHIPQPVGRLTIRSANGILVRLLPLAQP